MYYHQLLKYLFIFVTTFASNIIPFIPIFFDFIKSVNALSTNNPENEYKRCFNMIDNKPGCEFIKDRVTNLTTNECYTAHSSPSIDKTEQFLPFACHNAPCSVQNEAFWLGQFPYERDIEYFEGHFLDKPKLHYELVDAPDAVRRKYVFALNSYWRSFKRMHDTADNQLNLSYIEKLPTPDYAVSYPSSTDRPYAYPKDIVPLLCDPREYLTCEHSLHLALSDSSSGGGAIKPTGGCRCHPLYSEEGSETEERTMPPASKPIPPLPVCLGRAMVPCEFGRWVFRNGSQTLNKTNIIDDKLFDWGPVWTHHPSLDREAPFLAPEDLHDYRINLNKGYEYYVKTSRCMPTAKCELFYSIDERDKFRNGEIWAGFGIHPIIREMMLMSATKLCRCKFKESYSNNTMHDCTRDHENEVVEIV